MDFKIFRAVAKTPEFCPGLAPSKKFSIIAINSALALALTACGSSSSSSDSDDNDGKTAIDLESGADLSYDSFDDIIKCNTKREGKTAYIKDEKTLYTCEDGDWVAKESANSGVDMDDFDFVEESLDDLPACHDKREGSTAFVTDENSAYICNGRKWIEDETLMPTSSNILTRSSSSNNANMSSFALSGSSSSLPQSSSDLDASSSSRTYGQLDPSLVVKGTMTDPRDGKTYKTVRIGNTTWMAENLNYEGDSSYIKSYCFDNDPASCAKYGRLYVWGVPDTSYQKLCSTSLSGHNMVCKNVKKYISSLCPEGWGMPDFDDAVALLYAVDSSFGSERTRFAHIDGAAIAKRQISHTAGKVLKSTSGWGNDSTGASGNGEDLYGFSALPVGFMDENGEFVAGMSFLWLDDEDWFSTYAFAIQFDTEQFVKLSVYPKAEALSVRCIQRGNAVTPRDSSGLREGQVDPATVVKGTLTDERDGQVYKTVKIGNQTWMAENLNYAYNEPTLDEETSSFCYDRVASYCEYYGRLYLWSAAVDSVGLFSNEGLGCGKLGLCKSFTDCPEACSFDGTVRGVCPEGWHLPSQEEWETLYVAAGQDIAVPMLKSTSGWDVFKEIVENGWDEYGFSALPSGRYYYSSNRFLFDGVGEEAHFWTSDRENRLHPISWEIYFFMQSSTDEAASVRCIKDDGAPHSTPRSSSSTLGSSSSKAKSSSSVDMKSAWDVLNPDIQYGNR